MKAGKFKNSDNIFEQLEDFGKSTAKNTAESLINTFNPLKTLENNSPQIDKKDVVSKNAHTPLDLEKLKKKYENQDKAKADALAQRLFRRAKSEEENFFEKQKQNKLQETQAKTQEEERKKQQVYRQKIRNQQQIEPHGKSRRSIFSHKKVAQREQIEVKPATGKQ